MPDIRVELDYTGGERLTMNMGPQHPSAHGVFRAILTLEGETVVGVDAVIGYLHRCHEKLAETLTYVQYPIDRVEDRLRRGDDERVRLRAWRPSRSARSKCRSARSTCACIVAELQRDRLALLWLGTWCMDMGGALGGGATIFLYCIRERELVLDLFESLVGARLLYGFYQVGGVRYDIPAGWTAQCRDDGRPDRAAASASTSRCSRTIRSSRCATQGRRRDLARAGAGRRRRGTAAARLRRQLRPPARRSRIPRTRTSSSRCRSRPPATASPATACGWSSSASRSAIVRQALDGLPDGPISSRPGAEVGGAGAGSRRARPTRASRGRAARSAAT